MKEYSNIARISKTKAVNLDQVAGIYPNDPSVESGTLTCKLLSRSYFILTADEFLTLKNDANPMYLKNFDDNGYVNGNALETITQKEAECVLNFAEVSLTRKFKSENYAIGYLEKICSL